MQRNLFSIVIPAYNYAHTLCRAVESVLRQPGEDYDLLVVNDGSTDDTELVLAELSAKHKSCFRWISKPNSGAAATRNFGIEQTSGQFVIFLDADDALCVDGLRLLREVIETSPGVGMVVGGHISINEDGRETLYLPRPMPDEPYERIRQYLLTKTIRLSNGSVAMNRDIFDRYRYPQQFRNSEDLPVFAFVLANYPVECIKEPVVYVYKHADSLRHNIALAKSIGLQIVDEIFDPQRLPGKLQQLKEGFAIQRSLSLSRTCYLAGDKAGCREFFLTAFRRDWSVILRGSYLRNFIKSLYP